VHRVAEADADLHPSAAQVVEDGEVLGQPDRVVERQQADIAGEPHVPGASRHGGGARDPRGQVAVVHEVVLGEPDQVEAQGVEPGHLLEDGGVEVGRTHPGFRRIAEVVDDAHAERWGQNCELIHLMAAW
jgi:hypothetical protein